ncbi:MAG: type II toxin-antitoxin system HicB family antitoxin [Pyrinomonadaceae bacterium]
MLTYKAMYKFTGDGVPGEILDFPGAITCGKDLPEARRLLASALVDMAETILLEGESLPVPNPRITDVESNLEEPIYFGKREKQKTDCRSAS